jgi:hypothetical protein
MKGMMNGRPWPLVPHSSATRLIPNPPHADGTTTTVALKTLYREGGVRRFYRGVGPALIQGPLSRFGDTAANAGVLTLLNESASTRDLPIAVKTACASAAAGGFRIFLMPVDALKTNMQVEGTQGIPKLMAKVRAGGPSVLYHGAIAAAVATWAGHFPWCALLRFCCVVGLLFVAGVVCVR